MSGIGPTTQELERDVRAVAELLDSLTVETDQDVRRAQVMRKHLTRLVEDLDFIDLADQEEA